MYWISKYTFFLTEHGSLSDEEQRLMESIEQLNERLKGSEKQAPNTNLSCYRSSLPNTGRVLACEDYGDAEGIVVNTHTLV